MWHAHVPQVIAGLECGTVLGLCAVPCLGRLCRGTPWHHARHRMFIRMVLYDPSHHPTHHVAALLQCVLRMLQAPTPVGTHHRLVCRTRLHRACIVNGVQALTG